MTDHDNEQNSGERRYWLDDPRNVNKIVWALVVVCFGLFFADGFYAKHGLFSVEHLFAFYALFGFIMCVCLVLIAKWMRTFLMRPEDHYEPDD